MAIGRVARKLYAQQGEFGTVRKAYKEAFRRQMIANYAPANVIGRMFGFGSMFHTMAKKAFGVPEWNPRSLETGRPDIVPGQSQTRGRQGAARSTAMMRASDMVLADIAENTERTADAMENINKIAALEQKKQDLGENFKREQEFEENLKKIKPIAVEKAGESSRLPTSSPLDNLLASLFSGLPKLGDSLWKVALGGAAGLALGGMAIKGAGRLLLRFGPVGMILGGLYSGIEEYMKTGSFKTAISQFFAGATGGLLGPEFQNALKDAAQKAGGKGTTLFNQAKGGGGYVSTNSTAPAATPAAAPKAPGYSFWKDSALGRFLKRPFEPTGSAAAGQSKQEIIDGKPVVKMKISSLPVAPPQFFKGGLSNLGALNSAQTTSIGGLEGNLLNTIAQAEAPASGYDGIFGNNDRTQEFMKLTGGRRLTELSVAEVMALQPRFVSLNRARGGRANEGGAVGRYQIVTKTLRGLVSEMGLSGSETFSPQLQDQMAIHLLKRRGLDSFKEGKISASQFQNNLSMEWAGLPNVSGLSSYQGVGSNKATISSSALQTTLAGAPPLNVAAATTAARSTQAAASTAAGATSFQSSMTAPQAMSTTIVNNLPPAAFGASPQMNESVDEFVTRVMVAMGIVVQT